MKGKEDEVPTSVEKDREIKTMIKRNLEQKLYQMRRPVIDLIQLKYFIRLPLVHFTKDSVFQKQQKYAACNVNAGH